LCFSFLCPPHSEDSLLQGDAGRRASQFLNRGVKTNKNNKRSVEKVVNDSVNVTVFFVGKYKGEKKKAEQTKTRTFVVVAVVSLLFFACVESRISLSLSL
jgi:hypothetical protein